MTWAQLLALGYSASMIKRWVKTGWLHRVHRGVYAVGHARLTVRGRWMAAVLAGGPDAVLSHRAAAALWDIRPIPSGPIDVTSTSRHNLPGIRFHWSRSLHADDTALVDGIPVTSLARTLLDLAEILSAQKLRTTLEAAQRRDLLDAVAMHRLLARSNGRRGVRPLSQALKLLGDEAPWTQSELEREFLEFVREAGLPEPRCNVVVDGLAVDCFWPEHNLIVELDGYAFHKARRSFDEDRRRDTVHTVAGRRTVRVTKHHLHDRRAALERDFRALFQAGCL